MRRDGSSEFNQSFDIGSENVAQLYKIGISMRLRLDKRNHRVWETD